jgi:hypothetical protein
MSSFTRIPSSSFSQHSGRIDHKQNSRILINDWITPICSQCEKKILAESFITTKQWYSISSHYNIYIDEWCWSSTCDQLKYQQHNENQILKDIINAIILTDTKYQINFFLDDFNRFVITGEEMTIISEEERKFITELLFLRMRVS